MNFKGVQNPFVEFVVHTWNLPRVESLYKEEEFVERDKYLPPVWGYYPPNLEILFYLMKTNLSFHASKIQTPLNELAVCLSLIIGSKKSPKNGKL